MSPFTFIPEPRPFTRWMGPFSPARGKRSGFRFHRGRLGSWVNEESGIAAFWPVVSNHGAQMIATLVRQEWGGGRVLFLPNGYVVKPLQTDVEVGIRALIGRYHGAIVLERPGQSTFDLSQPGVLHPGDRWHGPTTTGLECAIQADGSLMCSWYHPSGLGRDKITELLRGADRTLAAAFRAARPGVAGGRVRITANGHIITNRQERNGTWESIYVGWIDPKSWTNWNKWTTKERT